MTNPNTDVQVEWFKNNLGEIKRTDKKGSGQHQLMFTVCNINFSWHIFFPTKKINDE